MPTLSKGDVVIVLYPFSDGSGDKPRPGVVVSAEALNAAARDVIVAMITSQVSGNPQNCEFDLADWVALGLKGPSRVRLDRLASIEVRRVGKKLGPLNASDKVHLDEKLRLALGL